MKRLKSLLETYSYITKKKIYNYYLLNAEETGDEHYKLLLTQSDKETLIQLLEGGEDLIKLNTY